MILKMKFLKTALGLFFATFLGLVTALQAGDAIKTAKGKLADEDFYRLIACGARPGGKCRSAPRRFSKGTVTLAVIMGRGAQIPQAKIKRFSQAIRKAVNHINGAGANVKYKLVSGSQAKWTGVKLYLVKAGRRQMITGTGYPLLDGQIMQRAITVHIPRSRNRLLTAGIALSRDIPDRHIDGIVLEELMQALGLPWDIENRWYQGRSVFAEVGNEVRKPHAQDKMVLRRHYSR